jgi:Holliday junction resolvase
MPVTGGFGNAGVPDFVACVQGKFFGIECKAGKNTTTALQNKHLSDIRAAGGVSLVIDETNVDNVTALILANLGEK